MLNRLVFGASRYYTPLAYLLGQHSKSNFWATVMGGGRGGAGGAAAPPATELGANMSFCRPEILKGPQGKTMKKMQGTTLHSSVALRALSCAEKTLAASGTPLAAQRALSVTQRTLSRAQRSPLTGCAPSLGSCGALVGRMTVGPPNRPRPTGAHSR